MNRFIFSGFADEIDPMIDAQFEHLNKLGIGYFEPRNVDNINVADLTEEQAKELKIKMDACGIKASSIGSPIGKINIDDEFEPHLEKLKNVIKIAKILDTKFIRMFSFYIPEGDDPAIYRDEVLLRMKAMVELAEQEDVILLHENEKGIYGDIASRCKDIFDNIKSPNLKGVFDPANFIQCGQTVYPDAYDMLRSDIVYMHVKDALSDGTVVPAGMGEGRWTDIIKALCDSGYEGFLSLEPHLGDFNGLGNLENGDIMKGLEKSTPGKFTLAYESIKKIVEEVAE